MPEQMVDPQGTILREIPDTRFKRDDVADTYAWCLRAHDAGGVINWARINQEIIARWSLSGLAYIKAEAWKQFEGCRRAS